ncbi:hypothetical protein GCM10010129_41010 [Streptomyces fumigatiscleroticus]|nr:hypothetical protein GCM10010129_41010 [Streptomyces fumigatiscleroticus]
MRKRLTSAFGTLAMAAAAALLAASPAHADPDWPFPNDCEKHNYSAYVTWDGEGGMARFTYDHTDGQTHNFYRSTWENSGDPIGNGWASCINTRQA